MSKAADDRRSSGRGPVRQKIRDRLIAFKKWRGDYLRRLRFLVSRVAGKTPAPRRIDFVIAGAQKSGTTALDHYLRAHAGVSMAAQKEVHFFDVDRHFTRGADYLWYHSFFDWSDSGKVFGEASPSYLFSAKALERLKAYNPYLKVIGVLRNPVERAFSHWNMERDRGEESQDFSDAIARELALLEQQPGPETSETSYILRGFYARQLERLWSLFPKEQTLILRYENLRQQPAACLAEVCSFLGLPPLENVAPQTVHARGYERSISDRERADLESVFAADLVELERLLAWDCSAWRGSRSVDGSATGNE